MLPAVTTAAQQATRHDRADARLEHIAQPSSIAPGRRRMSTISGQPRSGARESYGVSPGCPRPQRGRQETELRGILAAAEPARRARCRQKSRRSFDECEFEHVVTSADRRDVHTMRTAGRVGFDTHPGRVVRRPPPARGRRRGITTHPEPIATRRRPPSLDDGQRPRRVRPGRTRSCTAGFNLNPVPTTQQTTTTGEHASREVQRRESGRAAGRCLTAVSRG